MQLRRARLPHVHLRQRHPQLLQVHALQVRQPGRDGALRQLLPGDARHRDLRHFGEQHKDAGSVEELDQRDSDEGVRGADVPGESADAAQLRQVGVSGDVRRDQEDRLLGFAEQLDQSARGQRLPGRDSGVNLNMYVTYIFYVKEQL